MNRGHYPYMWLWTYAGDKNFEDEGEIKFSPVYAHDLLLLESLWIITANLYLEISLDISPFVFAFQNSQFFIMLGQ